MALASLCSQTYTNLEIFISDNASTDATTQIIAKRAVKGSRITVYRHKETVNMEGNFESVIRNVRGKWFCYAAHDDMWSSNYIEELLKPLLYKEDAIVSVPTRTLIDAKSNEHSTRLYKNYAEAVSFKEIVVRNFSILCSAWCYALFDKEAFLKLQASRVYFQETLGG